MKSKKVYSFVACCELSTSTWVVWLGRKAYEKVEAQDQWTCGMMGVSSQECDILVQESPSKIVVKWDSSDFESVATCRELSTLALAHQDGPRPSLLYHLEAFQQRGVPLEVMQFLGLKDMVIPSIIRLPMLFRHIQVCFQTRISSWVWLNFIEEWPAKLWRFCEKWCCIRNSQNKMKTSVGDQSPQDAHHQDYDFNNTEFNGIPSLTFAFHSHPQGSDSERSS